jgi:hypothetical protein
MIKTIVDRADLPWGMIHPITGKSMQALAWRSDGSPLWPLIGADDDGNGTSVDDGSEEDADDDEDSTDDADAEGASGEKTTDTVSKAEYDKLQAKFNAQAKQLSMADKNKSAAQKALDEIERKKRTDLENASADLKKSTEENAVLRGTLKNMALRQAFMAASMTEKVSWHDAAVAQTAAAEALAAIEVNDEGEVVGDLRKIVKELAKSHKYLVNNGSASDDEDDDTKPGPSGSNVGTGMRPKKKGDKKPSEGELRKMFPALNK